MFYEILEVYKGHSKTAKKKKVQFRVGRKAEKNRSHQKERHGSVLVCRGGKVRDVELGQKRRRRALNHDTAGGHDEGGGKVSWSSLKHPLPARHKYEKSIWDEFRSPTCEARNHEKG